MRKIYLLFFALIAGTASFAQTITNGDMEMWRTNTAGPTGSTTTIEAPFAWYGADSIFIGLGRTIGKIAFPGKDDSVWRRQLYKEVTTIHGGSSSAKILTTYQDTLLFPGVLSNAKASVGITITPKPGITGITYSGGTPVTLRPKTVSAWVEYAAGYDTATFVTGVDSGTLTVQAIAKVGTVDSIIGTGFVNIGPGTSFSQITANITYPKDTADSVTLLRVTFASSGGGGTIPQYHSVLYIDDVTMTGIPYVHTPPVDHSGVRNVADNKVVSVYPNPANGTLYLDGPMNAGLSCKLIAMNGQVVVTTTLTGHDAINTSALASGSYIYVIADANGSTIQNGTIAVNK
ncbi:MAG: C-terminal target protein [Flavipsychrobacter sp.]|nr:C-terminal target protein [Flavipsychrobacter sp.]